MGSYIAKVCAHVPHTYNTYTLITYTHIPTHTRAHHMHTETHMHTTHAIYTIKIYYTCTPYTPHKHTHISHIHMHITHTHIPLKSSKKFLLFWYVHVCMFMCVYVQGCVCVCAYTCVRTCVSNVDARGHPQMFLGYDVCLVFLRQSLSVVWNSSCRLGCLSSELHLLIFGVTNSDTSPSYPNHSF